MSRRRLIIARAEGEHDLNNVRDLFREYADWLKVDYCFKDFAAELAGLPGAYAPPRGGLWLARVDGKIAGCIGFRPLDETTCEMKRLWVRDTFRRLGLGRRLAETCLAAAREAGYATISLETVGHMAEARGLYESLRFREVSAAAGTQADDIRSMQRDLAIDDGVEVQAV